MTHSATPFELRFARDEEDIRAAQRLRYRVFVEELGSDGDMVDHEAALERDALDPHYQHLMLIDPQRSGDPLEQCVGVYRLLTDTKAAEIGGFYSASEYDLSVLENSGRRLLELGRSCVAAEYRGGTALFQLWAGLAKYVLEGGFDVLFGTASFFGTNLAEHAAALSFLHHRHLAPPALRARALPAHFQPMDLVADHEIDRRDAMMAIPALIKAYLRMGGAVAEGAFVDRAFNTVDVLLILDVDKVSDRQREMYSKGLD